MRSTVLSALFIFSIALGGKSALATQIVPDDILKTIQDKGLTGLIHGADDSRDVFVFTYNVPGDFFTRYEFSLLPSTEEQRKLLATFRRGDKVFVKGNTGAQDTPQPHIYVKELNLLEKYDPGVEAPAGKFEKTTNLPEELKGKSEMIAQVHAVAGGGEVVVLEYKEVIVPLVVHEPELAKDLYRGDLLKVEFDVQGDPKNPTHLVLKSSKDLGHNPLTVMEKMKDLNNKKVSVEGRLVLFPKSPTISQDVWAIEQDIGYGLFRYFTLVNFTQVKGKLEELEKINKKMRELWDTDPKNVMEGRNKFVHTKIRIKVAGILTVISPSQANAQVNLKATDIEAL